MKFGLNNKCGRPKGSRNKFSTQFVEALAADFHENGPDVIRIVRIEEPATYLKVCASLIPKEFTIETSEYADLSDQEVGELLEVVNALLARRPATEPREMGHVH